MIAKRKDWCDVTGAELIFVHNVRFDLLRLIHSKSKCLVAANIGHNMVAEVNRSGRQRRYNDEDTSPTSERELLGFYSYGLAAEVFAVCGVGM